MTQQAQTKKVSDAPEAPQCDHNEMVRDPVGKYGYWMCAKCHRPYGKPELPRKVFIPDNSGGGTWETWKDERPRAQDYKAQAEALAEALRDARNYIWESGYFNTDSPLIAQIDDALAKWKAGQ